MHSNVLQLHTGTILHTVQFFSLPAIHQLFTICWMNDWGVSWSDCPASLQPTPQLYRGGKQMMPETIETNLCLSSALFYISALCVYLPMQIEVPEVPVLWFTNFWYIIKIGCRHSPTNKLMDVSQGQSSISSHVLCFVSCNTGCLVVIYMEA